MYAEPQRYPTAGQLDLTEANVTLNATVTTPPKLAVLSESDYAVLDSKPVLADPSEPQGERLPVPGPGEDQSGIFESQYSHLSGRNSTLAPELQIGIAHAAFLQAEASANGTLPAAGYLDPLAS